MNPSSLRIGFSTIYAWRPHTEHMMFLAGLVREAGHAPVFLACDADLSACYTRELRGSRPDWLECLLCRAGGVRSYPAGDISSIGSLAREAGAAPVERAREWAASSASTLKRFEAAADYEGEEFLQQRDRLAGPAAVAYAAAREWIRREQLDAVLVFNGRIDATRAVFEAARDAGVRAITFERTLFGDGIQLLPEENCLGLRTIHRMVGEWHERPLTEGQARTAVSYVASRLSATNDKEWRAFNTRAVAAPWPTQGRRRILLLPGSLNEVWGDPGWRGGWPDIVTAYDAIIERLGLAPEDMVLRCHPIWAERIGRNDGRHAEAHYTAWARARGIHVIASADRASTMALIAQCDAIALGSGSAAIEAAALGKQVIATEPSIYQEAGFRTDVTSPERLHELVLDVDLPPAQQHAAQDRLRRGVLRFLYTMAHRYAQYVRHVKTVSTTAYRYVPGADPQRLIDLVRTGILVPDDAEAATGTAGEDIVLERMRAGDWAGLCAPAAGPEEAASTGPRRRWFLQPVDFIREKMPVGDR